MTFDIAVIGGGASGLIAALRAKQCAPSLRVCVLERQPRAGKKLLATGNGRCNITNMLCTRERYHGDPAFAMHAIERHPPEDVRAFFSRIGVETAEEEDGKVYPLGDQASAVLDALRLSLSETGAEEICDCDITDIVKTPRDMFRLRPATGESILARRVIVACGGLAAPNLGGSASGQRMLKSFGHISTPCLPALVQLKTPVEPIRALKGIKYTGDIDVLTDGTVARTERGEVLFTEYGLSGPPVLQISRIASVALAEGKRVSARLHVLPQSPAETLALLRTRRQNLAARPLEHFLTGLVNKRMGQTLLKHAGAQPFSRLSGTLTDDELRRVAALLAGWELPVIGTQSFAQAQVTAGGVETRLFHPDTLESERVKGLYAAGELLNVDGDCGGFNLQWAWASGLTAAESAARSLLP